jgi:hypothetical protein
MAKAVAGGVKEDIGGSEVLRWIDNRVAWFLW